MARPLRLAALAALPIGARARSSESRVLHFSHLHTGERLEVEYFSAGVYLPDALGGDAASAQLVLAAYVGGSCVGLLGFGAGTWGGQQGFAMGFSKASDNGRIIVKAQGTINTRGDGGAAVGVGFQF